MDTLALRGVPWAWHLMDDVPLPPCTAADRLEYAFAKGFARHPKGTILACAQQIVDEIDRGGVTLADDVEIIPYGIAGPLGPPRSSYRNDGRLKVVSAAGMIDRPGDKGLDLIVQAVALLRNSGIENITIDLFGEIVDGSIPDMIRAFNLEEMVHLRGTLPQSELIARFADYDLFTLPARPREPFGFVALEAAAMGCVPVLSRRCGIAEWLVHGVHALKIARNPAALAPKLARPLTVLDDYEPYRHVAQREALQARIAHLEFAHVSEIKVADEARMKLLPYADLGPRSIALARAIRGISRLFRRSA